MTPDKRVEEIEKTFIETEQEMCNITDILVLSKEPWDMSYDLEESQKNLDILIEQAITNVGNELLWLIEKDEAYGGAKELVKKHITSVTGVK